MIIYPNKINCNDTIGVTATSSGVVGDKIIQLDEAYKTLNNFGFTKFIETKNVRTNSKFVSSSAIDRANQFMDLWKNDDVSLIANVRGGEFLIEILPYLDSGIFTSYKPKWITGYSDTSLLNYFITTNFDIATATCSNILHFAKLPLHKSLTEQVTILQSVTTFTQHSFDLYESNHTYSANTNAYNLDEKVIYKHLYNKKSDKFSGRLLGGCIDTISQLLGTPLDNTNVFISNQSEGIVWYLENCELTLLELKRRLFQMKLSGWFKNANAIILGRTAVDKIIDDLTYTDVLHDIFDDMKIPVVYDCDFGHVPPQWTMINGAFVKFEYNNGKATLTTEFI